MQLERLKTDVKAAGLNSKLNLLDSCLFTAQSCLHVDYLSLLVVRFSFFFFCCWVLLSFSVLVSVGGMELVKELLNPNL